MLSKFQQHEALLYWRWWLSKGSYLYVQAVLKNAVLFLPIQSIRLILAYLLFV